MTKEEKLVVLQYLKEETPAPHPFDNSLEESQKCAIKQNALYKLIIELQHEIDLENTICKYNMEDYENTRDSMTPNDIVNHLTYIGRRYIPDYNFTGDEDDFERYKLHIAINKAIEIIESVKYKKKM